MLSLHDRRTLHTLERRMRRRDRDFVRRFERACGSMPRSGLCEPRRQRGRRSVGDMVAFAVVIAVVLTPMLLVGHIRAAALITGLVVLWLIACFATRSVLARRRRTQIAPASPRASRPGPLRDAPAPDFRHRRWW